MYKHFLDRWFRGLTGHVFAVRFWDGSLKTYGEGSPTFTIIIKKESVLGEIARNLSLGFGEAYMRGDVDVEGSVPELCAMFHGTDIKNASLSFGAKVANFILRQQHRGRLGRAQKNVEHHYDLGNDFYAMWLGKERLYSCAYFKAPHDSIDTAQANKLEHICKKLFLQAGETLLDVGCGWGALVIHAAKKYGVKAYGITLSKGQFEYASQRVREEGLTDQITIELVDYRELIRRGVTFDKVVSVGMFEHVGLKQYPEYFAATDQLMKPGGIGVLHTIGKMQSGAFDPWVEKYIFPGAHLPGLDEIASTINRFAFRVTDIENWRPHYAFTLDHWLEGFEANIEKVRGMYGESFVRMWRLYLAGSSAGFRYGDLDLWQIQFTKGLRNDLPLTREYLYQE